MSVQIKSDVLLERFGHLPTKSAVIRAMFAAGVKKTVIAKELDIRYQHVRNVLEQPLKRQG